LGALGGGPLKQPPFIEIQAHASHDSLSCRFCELRSAFFHLMFNKNSLRQCNFCSTLSQIESLNMANTLKTEKKTAIASMLCEGSSIRGIERMTGVHRDTIMRFGVRLGEGCKRIMDEKLRVLDARLIQVDEVWGFIQMKQKTANRLRTGETVGDVWTWVAIDAESKLVSTFAVGDRSQYMANCFIEDLASRLSHRVQISSDALKAYGSAIERAFGSEVDYGSIVKTFSHTDLAEQRRYSPPEVMHVERHAVKGEPVVDLISTSYVEKQNHTLPDALPQAVPAHECIFQEDRKLQGCRRPPLRILQLREVSQNAPMHASDGRWRHRFLRGRSAIWLR
jgi:transposase-like protein